MISTTIGWLLIFATTLYVILRIFSPDISKIFEKEHEECVGNREKEKDTLDNEFST